MKAFFLTGSIVTTVLILILAFENMYVSLTNFTFIFASASSSFLVVLGLCFVGVIAGIFYSGLIQQLLKSEDTESGGNEW